MLEKTYKFRLYPTKKQWEKLDWTVEVCRHLYNSCLIDRKNFYQRNGIGLSRVSQQEILRRDKDRVEFLHDVYSQVLQEVLFRLDKAYQNFFRRIKLKKEGRWGRKVGYPRLKGQNRYDSITYPQYGGFQILNGGKKLKLSKIGAIRMRMHRQIEGQIKQCTIRKDVDRWYACFSVQYNPLPQEIPDTETGMDVGLTVLGTLSNGEKIENPKYLKQAENKLKKLQRSVSKKKKGSKNRNKARIKIARQHRKVRNQRSDGHHKKSRKLVDAFGLIKVENLHILNMVKNHYLAKAILDAAWGMLFLYIAYKAAEAGSRFEKVDPKGTTIDCSRCHKPVPKTLAIRVHRCPFCGMNMDRDQNAAINILQR